MPRDPVRVGARRRLLHHSVLRSQHVDRHPVVGVVLAERRRQSRPRLDRSPDGPDDHHPVDHHQRVAASRLLRQGDRRLDVHVSRLRVRRAARVRARQRAGAEARNPHHSLDTAARPARPSAADRRHAGPAAATGARESRGEPTRPGSCVTITHRLSKVILKPFGAHCCHMGTAIKHPVPDRVKPSFVIFDIRALWR